MTRRQENKLTEILDDLCSEVHENNIMLRQIVKVINVYLARHHAENDDDFNRNVLANMVSNVMGFGR
jgi:hypothetical protein